MDNFGSSKWDFVRSNIIKTAKEDKLETNKDLEKNFLLFSDESDDIIKYYGFEDEQEEQSKQQQEEPKSFLATLGSPPGLPKIPTFDFTPKSPTSTEQSNPWMDNKLTSSLLGKSSPPSMKEEQPKKYFVDKNKPDSGINSSSFSSFLYNESSFGESTNLSSSFSSLLSSPRDEMLKKQQKFIPQEFQQEIPFIPPNISEREKIELGKLTKNPLEIVTLIEFKKILKTKPDQTLPIRSLMGNFSKGEKSAQIRRFVKAQGGIAAFAEARPILFKIFSKDDPTFVSTKKRNKGKPINPNHVKQTSQKPKQYIKCLY